MGYATQAGGGHMGWRTRGEEAETLQAWKTGPESPGQGQRGCRQVSWAPRARPAERGGPDPSAWPSGKSYTMIGRDSSPRSLGVVPCAISWLFRLIDEQKEQTGTRFSIRVSAVEVCGRDQGLQDLLAEVAAGSLQDTQSPGVYLREDPVCGAQVGHHLHHPVGSRGGRPGRRAGAASWP